MLMGLAALLWVLPNPAQAGHEPERKDIDLLSFDQAVPIPSSDAPPVALAPPPQSTPHPAAAKPAKESPKKKKKRSVVAPTPPPAAAPKVSAVQLPATPAAKPGMIIPKLRPGDYIRVDIKDEAELSGSFPVNADGKVALPLLSPLQGAGLTLLEFKDAVTAAYRDGYLVDPKVSVSKSVPPPAEASRP